MSPSELANWFLYIADYLMIAVLVAGVIFVLLFWYFFAYFANALKKDEKLPKGITKYKYAILVPARNEDKVISNLLNSLKNQTYPKELYKVFVIVESKDDPTVKITKKFGYEIIIRKDLINKRTKGYALDEAYKYIKEKGYYFDAYMVFDADNVVDLNYIDLMNDVKNAGYKVGMGYRNFTNASKNWISACSATLFAYMNQYTSKGRSRMFKKMTLTGTGYYIDSDIIDNVNGWIFNGMTEDVELTKYCYYHNVPMKYYPIAQYYDEQPTKYSVIHKQHIRWVWGYFAKDKKYKEKSPDYGALNIHMKRLSLFEFNVSIYPVVAIIVLLCLAFLMSFGLLIASIVYCFFYEEFITMQVPSTMFVWMLIYFAFMFLPFGLAAFVTFVISNKYLKFKTGTIVKVLFSYMFFFFDFLFAFFDGLIHKSKRTTWDKIAHEGKITSKEALKSIKDESK